MRSGYDADGTFAQHAEGITNMKRLWLALPLLLSAAPALAEPDYAAAIRADWDKDLGATFEWFHRNPELSFKEVATGARMAKELRAIPGIVVTEKVGGTGVVGVLKNGAGPTVLLRADMDGLPVEEKSGLPYASKARQVGVDGVENPVMHACGHDTHITGLVATARRLAALKDRWSGTVVFVVQPAEERVGGAKAMIADGLFTRFPKPDYALGWHVAAGIRIGLVSGSEDIQYSSADSVDIRVNGVATHGASPQLGKDPVYIASQMVQAFQGIIGRERAPLSPGLITVGAFHGGAKHNIIADHADLQVTVRSNGQATRDVLIAAIERTAKGIAAANGAPPPVVKVNESTPVTTNNRDLARRVNGAFSRDLGAAAVKPWEQVTMGAEDFAYYVAPEHKIPGFFWAVGGTPQADLDAEKNGGPPVSGHHSGLFKVDGKASVVTGATSMTAAVLELLGKN
jgi:amidohydrolase